MPIDNVDWPLVELAPGELRPTEMVMRPWPSPGGMGILTRERCLIVGHPHPVHRWILWSEDLEMIESFGVSKSPVASVPEFSGRGFSMGGGVMLGHVGGGRLDDYFRVEVDSVPVFVGYIDHCEMIQRWIDEARTARLQATHTEEPLRTQPTFVPPPLTSLPNGTASQGYSIGPPP